jgi:hypothetical protein
MPTTKRNSVSSLRILRPALALVGELQCSPDANPGKLSTREAPIPPISAYQPPGSDMRVGRQCSSGTVCHHRGGEPTPSAVYRVRCFATAGGLMTYFCRCDSLHRQNSQRRNPSELPVQARYKLWINLKTAKTSAPADHARPRRRGDRIVAAFAALHMSLPVSLPGTKRTYRDVCYLSAFGAKRTWPNDRAASAL